MPIFNLLCLISNHDLSKTHRNISNCVFYIFVKLFELNQMDTTQITHKIQQECN